MNCNEVPLTVVVTDQAFQAVEHASLLRAFDVMAVFGANHAARRAVLLIISAACRTDDLDCH